MRKLALAIALVLVVLGMARPVAAGEVEKTFPFELDTWYDLGVTDGPVTLHRVRVKHDTRGLTKSKLFRGPDSPYSDTVVIELEYTNTSDKDWEAACLIHWLDAKGNVIDGYDDDEGLGEDEKKETATMTIATLKYGLEMAKKLYVKVAFHED
ncbi:MAG: hypothetical protein KDD11_05850 [Acidobacteria bacterium]|nr:hypothetical protein [Acidobacteriota bacterium]